MPRTCSRAPRVRPASLSCLLVFGLLLPRVLAAEASPPPDETGRPVFRNFRPTDYRGHPQVYSLVTAPNGLVYLSSEQGINEFDGIRWRHLSVPVSMVFALQATPGGRVWLSGQDEFGYFAPTAAGELTYRSLTTQLPAELKPAGRIRSLVVMGDTAYFSTGRRLVRWQEGRTHIWELERSSPRLHAAGRTLYLHAAGRGLLRVEGDQLVAVSTAEPFLQNTDSALFPLADGRFLAVLPKSGFFQLDPATGALTPWATPAAALLRDTRVTASARLRDGSFVIGTQTIGLVILSADGTRVRRLDRTTGLLDNVVLSLAPDPAGGLWVGYNTGAARVELDSPVSVFDGNNGPAAGTIDCWGRHEGTLYAGAFDGLWRLVPGDPTTGAGAHFVKDPRSLPNVFAIEPLDDDTLIAAGGGLGRLRADRIEPLLDCGANAPFCLVVSRVVPGRVYLGGQLGLTVAQKTPAGWIKLAEFHHLGDIHTAAEQADGTLWLATYSRGFWEIPRAHTITDWAAVKPTQFYKDCGLPASINWTAVFDAPGGASLFTDKGSYRLDPTGTRFILEDRFPIPGESRPAIYPLVRAANGDGWATVYTTSTLETDYPFGRFKNSPAALASAPPASAPTPVWQPAPAAALAEIGFAGAAVMAL
ncbi:MAG: hypothetical protein H7343_02430, partial [Undibacterium sp.]|nr:hypothetical protein [Opitutaceae bacterium]